MLVGLPFIPPEMDRYSCDVIELKLEFPHGQECLGFLSPPPNKETVIDSESVDAHQMALVQFPFASALCSNAFKILLQICFFYGRVLKD